MDVESVEVLKGPQALFFGKNSPAGVISVRTADPTSSFAAGGTAGYEMKAREWRGTAYVSGPLSDQLGFRVAGYFSDMKGWSKNLAPRSGTGVLPVNSDRGPNRQDWALRGTLKWEASDRFSARLKMTYSKLKGSSSTENYQLVDCPRGFAQNGTIDTCRADDKIYISALGPNVGKLDARFGDGSTFLEQKQFLGGLELNYDIMDTLTLTSVSGYYDLDLGNRANYTYGYLEGGAPPRQILASFNFLHIKEISQELRLATDLDGPLNMMLGGHFQSSRVNTGSVTYRNALAPSFVNNYNLTQKGTAYSAFGQFMYKIVPELELSVGGRYSFEKKHLPSVRSGLLLPEIPPGVGARYRANWNDFSPEVMLTYRPNNNLTVYGGYKKGFLSGGFNSGITNFAANLEYGPQATKGFEGGVKARLLDGRLRTNLSIYNYKTKGLQVTVSVEGGLFQELRNAGAVRTKGAEFDFVYDTPLSGLSLNGAIAYNKGRYIDYQASCYAGQSSLTCFPQLNRQTNEIGILQELSGTQLVRSPDWSGNLGFHYETAVGSGLKLGLSGNGSFSGGYFTQPSSSPGSRQKAYELFDASVSVGDADDQWELALIGRNLGNKYYFTRSTDAPFTGTTPGLSVAGGIRGDTSAAVSRGREIMIRARFKFGG